MKDHEINSFLGTGWSFPPTFRKELPGVELTSGIENIYGSMLIILQTITGERVMNPDFGCNLRPYVFESLNIPNTAMIKKIVFEALTYHEPRIKVEEIKAEVNSHEGSLLLTIPFTVITTNTRHNYVYPFYTGEATDIDHT